MKKQYIEIVNWKKAQPKMKGKGNTWFKTYTSLLEHDGFAGLEDASRVLIWGIWMYAARSGHHILPADPKWLWRQIPMLHTEPNLKPLLETKDIYGHPTPFLRLCEAPGAQDSGSAETTPPVGPGGRETGDQKKARPRRRPARRPAAKKAGNSRRPAKPAKTPKAKTKAEQKRVEQRREEQKREDETLSGFGKEPEERKSLAGFSKEDQGTAEQSRPEPSQATAAQNSPEPEKPENPTKSDAGSAQGHHVPLPTRSAYHRGPEAIGAILDQQFQPWWREPECEAFGWEIVEALGYSTDRLNLQSRNQWGVFAAWWYRVKSSVPDALMAELRTKAIAKAREISGKRRRHVKNPGAMWVFIMDQELLRIGVTLPDPRAGPEAVSN